MKRKLYDITQMTQNALNLIKPTIRQKSRESSCLNWETKAMEQIIKDKS